MCSHGLGTNGCSRRLSKRTICCSTRGGHDVAPDDKKLAAKLGLGKARTDSATQCLKELHCLPTHLSMECKVLVRVFKSLNKQATGYLKSMFQRLSIASDIEYEVSFQRISLIKQETSDNMSDKV